MLTVLCSGCRSPLRVREEYAGKALRCPTCGTLMRAPGDDMPEVLLVSEGPPPARPQPTRTKACPGCRRRSPLRARLCRFCGAGFEAARSKEEISTAPASEFLPCPQCDAAGAERIRWTIWGSFYGPALLAHVRCPECDCRYNGKTGKSNLLWAILFVAVPATLILGIVGGAALMILHSMHQ